MKTLSIAISSLLTLGFFCSFVYCIWICCQHRLLYCRSESPSKLNRKNISTTTLPRSNASSTNNLKFIMETSSTRSLIICNTEKQTDCQLFSPNSDQRENNNPITPTSNSNYLSPMDYNSYSNALEQSCSANNFEIIGETKF